MPIAMSSKLARCVTDALLSRGYHSSGVAILRPSTSVTTSSVAVNSTDRGRRSPTSISKVLIPSCQQIVSMQSQVTDNITKFVRGKSGVDGDREIMKPEFSFSAAGTNVNVRRFISFVGVEERAIGSPPQNRWHLWPRFR